MMAMLIASCGTGCSSGHAGGNWASNGAAAKAPPQLDASTQPFSTPPMQTTVTPIQVRQMDLPVKEGSMPLAYLVETTGGVRVVDETTNSALAQTTATGRSIVSIDAVHGVSIGGINFTAGPLPADHRYAVFFESGGFNPEEDVNVSTEHSDPQILKKHDQSEGGFLHGAGGSTTGPSPQP
jgi:hypothetical protein